VGVADGAEAVRAYKAAREAGQAFDVVILDLTISGGMGGQETVAELLALDPAARVIVSSGYSNDPVMANHRTFGFAAVLSKPYRLEQMKETLASVVQP
jgi:CheY-like chemotaxis protein